MYPIFNFSLDFVQLISFEILLKSFEKENTLLAVSEQPIESYEFRVATYSVEVFKNIRHKGSPPT